MSQQKVGQNVFVMSSKKFSRFWQNMAHTVLNKCTTKYCTFFSSLK